MPTSTSLKPSFLSPVMIIPSLIACSVTVLLANENDSGLYFLVIFDQTISVFFQLATNVFAAVPSSLLLTVPSRLSNLISSVERFAFSTNLEFKT